MPFPHAPYWRDGPPAVGLFGNGQPVVFFHGFNFIERELFPLPDLSPTQRSMALRRAAPTGRFGHPSVLWFFFFPPATLDYFSSNLLAPPESTREPHQKPLAPYT